MDQLEYVLISNSGSRSSLPPARRHETKRGPSNGAACIRGFTWAPRRRWLDKRGNEIKKKAEERGESWIYLVEDRQLSVILGSHVLEGKRAVTRRGWYAFKDHGITRDLRALNALAHSGEPIFWEYQAGFSFRFVCQVVKRGESNLNPGRDFRYILGSNGDKGFAWGAYL